MILEVKLLVLAAYLSAVSLDFFAQQRQFSSLFLERGIGARIGGVLFVCIGLGVMVGIGLPSLLQEPSFGPLMFVLVPLIFVYAGLYAAGLDLWEWVLALINRSTWQRLQVTAEKRP